MVVERKSLILFLSLIGLLVFSTLGFYIYQQGYFTTSVSDNTTVKHSSTTIHSTSDVTHTAIQGDNTYGICEFECSHPECTKLDCISQCVSSTSAADFTCAAGFGEEVQFGDLAITIDNFEINYSQDYSAFDVTVENKGPGVVESIVNVGIATGQHAILSDNLGNVYYPQAFISPERYRDGDVYGGSKLTGKIFFEKLPESATRFALQLFPQGPNGNVYKYVLKK